MRHLKHTSSATPGTFSNKSTRIWRSVPIPPDIKDNGRIRLGAGIRIRPTQKV